MKRLLFYYIIMSLFFGCDVPGRIELINTTGKKVIYNLYMDSENEINQIDSLKSFTFTEVSSANNNSVILLFGFGYFWTDSHIKGYIDDVSKVEIMSINDTIIITDKDEMFKYYRKHRKGFLKKTISIKF